MPDLKSFRAPLFVCVALALVVAGCGRRGALETPESEPRAPAQQTSGQSKERGAPTGKAPDRPFILDAIL